MATHYDVEKNLLNKIMEDKTRVIEALEKQVKQHERTYKPVKTINTFKHYFKAMHPELNFEEYTKEAATKQNDPVCMQVQARIEELKAQNREWAANDADYRRMKDVLTKLRVEMSHYKKRYSSLPTQIEEEEEGEEVQEEVEEPPKKKIKVVVEDSKCDSEENQCVVCATNYACITSVECNHKVVCLDCLTKIHETSGRNKTRCPICRTVMNNYLISGSSFPIC